MRRKTSQSSENGGDHVSNDNSNTPLANAPSSSGLSPSSANIENVSSATKSVMEAIQQYQDYIKALDDPGNDASKQWRLPPPNPNLSNPSQGNT